MWHPAAGAVLRHCFADDMPSHAVADDHTLRCVGMLHEHPRPCLQESECQSEYSPTPLSDPSNEYTCDLEQPQAACTASEFVAACMADDLFHECGQV